MTVDLACSATSSCRGAAEDPDRQSSFSANRFEQSLEATGTVVIDGHARQVRAGAHRDRSWGPREWRQVFTIGDVQGTGCQLYFVGRTFPGLGGGYLRIDDDLQQLILTDGSIDFDDDARTFRSATMAFAGGDDFRVQAALRPIAPSVSFDMAHTCDVPEQWLYYRTLVEATVDGWDGSCRGWFESSRYGLT
jgi:hypothetical protein